MPKAKGRKLAFLAVALMAALALIVFAGSFGASRTYADDPLVMPKIVVTQDGTISEVAIILQNPKNKNIGLVDFRATIPAGMTVVKSDAFARLEGDKLHWVTKLGYSSSKQGFWFRLDPKGQTGNVTVSLTFAGGEASGASSATAVVPAGAAAATVGSVQPTAAVVATAKPVGVIDVVGVRGRLDDANAIVKVLESTGAKVGMSTSGLPVMSVGVPAAFAGNSSDPKGPATSFAWTLTGPTASKAKLNATNTPTVSFTPDVVGYYKIDLVASNSLGASPMASVQVRADTYVGVTAGGCVACHTSETKEWGQTNHAIIFKREIDGGADPATSHYGEGCVRCHSTGYQIGVANGGFADVQAKTGWQFPDLAKIQTGKGNWDAVPSSLKAMANIQCEDCHGPAQAHVKSGAPMAASLDVGVCNACHDGGGHHVKGTLLAASKHDDADSQAFTYPVGPTRTDCVRCHSGSGFISFLAAPTEKASWNTDMQTITCAVCHEPHSEGNPRQLRIAGKPVEVNGIAKDFSQSAICTECHNARNTGADAVKGSTPHYSAAAEMLADTGGVTYGKTVPNSPHGLIVGASPIKGADGADAFGGQAPGPCVACHMFPTIFDAKDPNYLKVGDHSFNMANGTFEYTAACQSCHAGITNFDLKAKADYDGNGKVEGVQEEVAGLLTKLQSAIGASGIKPVVGHPYFDQTGKANWTAKQNNAIYNYLLVRGLEDSKGKSSAIHNFQRSVALLQLSYADLTGTQVPNATILVK